MNSEFRGYLCFRCGGFCARRFAFWAKFAQNAKEKPRLNTTGGAVNILKLTTGD
jgi:hypothetical protein